MRLIKRRYCQKLWMLKIKKSVPYTRLIFQKNYKEAYDTCIQEILILAKFSPEVYGKNFWIFGRDCQRRRKQDDKGKYHDCRNGND